MTEPRIPPRITGDFILDISSFSSLQSFMPSFFTTSSFSRSSCVTRLNTCAIPIKPTTRGMKLTPLSKCTTPNVYLASPVFVLIPMVATRMPMQVIASPFNTFPSMSQLMELNATSISVVISAGPNFKPNSASAGPKKVSMIMPISPPTKEDMFDTINAFPGFPFRANG